jgi:hypothetical protein
VNEKGSILGAAVMVPIIELTVTGWIVLTIFQNMNRDHEAQMIGGLTAISIGGFLAAVLTVALFVYLYLRVSQRGRNS